MQELDDKSWILCANLPYNIAVPVVMESLELAPGIRREVVMVQREVGERLAARPGDEHYGAVSVRVAYRASAAVIRRVPTSVFWPRPRVDSVVVSLDRLETSPVDVALDRLWPVVDGAFGERRKTMRNALRRAGLDAAAADRVLRDAGVDPSARPEELDLATFARIAERVGV
jgi:16S rRNA (adenine1518-N6/adenine1519-N6)-dimethyltransferase